MSASIVMIAATLLGALFAYLGLAIDSTPKWYRWLRGGMWIYAWGTWHLVRPERYAYLIGCEICHVEAHRWPWQFKSVPQETREFIGSQI